MRFLGDGYDTLSREGRIARSLSMYIGLSVRLGGVAQWLGRRSMAGELSLIYA